MGKLRSPTPTPGPTSTPTPTPTPTPFPTATPTPTVSISSASVRASSLAGEVVASNAGLMAASSEAAAGQAEELQAATRKISAASAGGQLLAAEASLADANDAYRQAEVAVFYANPDVVEELSALPDPLGVGNTEGSKPTLAALQARLDRLRKLARSSGGDVPAEAAIATWLELGTDLSRMKDDLRAFAKAWDPSDPSNFRNRVFVEDTGGAVARIFQGLLAMTGDVLPSKWLDPAAGWSPEEPRADEIAGRIEAVWNIYEGSPSPGLKDLVSEVSPTQDFAVQVALARALTLARSMANTPVAAETRRQLLLSLGNATRELTLAAELLGIRIVDTAATP